MKVSADAACGASTAKDEFRRTSPEPRDDADTFSNMMKQDLAIEVPVAKPTTVNELNYESKPTDYFEGARPELLPFVPTQCKRLLDVGCGGGGFGASLKQTRDIEVWGVEPVPSAAAKAKVNLDHVVEGLFESSNPLPAGIFDCVMFNDVLEHMLVPEQSLKYARTLLAPGGVVVASIPNFRNFPVIWQIIYHASWEYNDCGVLDRTHLRFFTKSSIENMFTSEGYEVETIQGINAYVGIPNASKLLWFAYKTANVLSFGMLRDMRFQQFVVVARPQSATCAFPASNGVIRT